ncbi:hypothetical protein DFJ58DRAFT_725653 [Suillus subalutaceus]|uniref:uncharacterized protein n=1 Tax=Suillus subalutaceus TaxID=48586 RepID=UPI001B862A97|nr:uncharacterized protein DFJ58DRAFT_725653 [Suillus subalutaceus]KAG1861809.1 hypothetical protein DFJ58DRAFT_725653 [Suillus subalutaceus]
MPCNHRPGPDDGEDFEAEINAVTSDKSNSSDGSDSDQSGSDLDQLRLVLAVPGANAQMHEVRKALAIAQQAYNTTRSKLHVLKRQYLTLSAVIPARSRNRVFKKTSPLDSGISHQGQRYTLYCHFWVANGLFPTMPQPGIDSRSATHWTSPEEKLKGAMAELYSFIPKDLHQSMETYSRFSSLLRELDPSLFADKPSKKEHNKDLLGLLKKNGEGNFIRLAPVLFAKPNAMAADEFLKSMVLIKIVRIEVFGNAILGGKTRGHPKGRGLRMGAQSVSEGMIAGAAILARFLLTHDAKLTAIGAETKIDYQKDFDFYLERLLKGTPWAISVMEYFNKEVFNTTAAPSAPTSTVVPAAAPCTWEDDFLQELDNIDSVPHNASPSHSSARAPSPALSTLSTVSTSTPAIPAVVHDDHPTSTTMNFTSSTQMSVSQMCVTSASTQLHFGINQLSLNTNDNIADSVAAAPAPLTTGSQVPARRKGRVTAQAAAQDTPTEAPKTKCVSGCSKKATTKYTK